MAELDPAVEHATHQVGGMEMMVRMAVVAMLGFMGCAAQEATEFSETYLWRDSVGVSDTQAVTLACIQACAAERCDMFGRTESSPSSFWGTAADDNHLVTTDDLEYGSMGHCRAVPQSFAEEPALFAGYDAAGESLVRSCKADASAFVFNAELGKCADVLLVVGGEPVTEIVAKDGEYYLFVE